MKVKLYCKKIHSITDKAAQSLQEKIDVNSKYSITSIVSSAFCRGPTNSFGKMNQIILSVSLGDR